MNEWKVLKKELDDIKVELSRIASSLQAQNMAHKYDWLSGVGVISGVVIGVIVSRFLL